MAMSEREQRGLAIAQSGHVKKQGWVWMVPSQSGNGSYAVVTDNGPPKCSCPDHETRGVVCKHMFAVQFVEKMQANSDGSEVLTQTITITETRRKTYSQDWPAYNAAQVNEKAKFQSLLHDLCLGVAELPNDKKRGRKRIPLRDILFSAAFKIYSTFSGRRFMTDLREAYAKGYISKLPHYNSIFNYLEMPELTPILRGLITQTAKPLKGLEDKFAVDSTGFSTCRYVRWFDEKWGKEKTRKVWVKAHVVVGTLTNVVTSVEIGNSGDCPMFPVLVKDTAKNFTMKEISGDKAYLSADNLELANELGAEPFIPFKTNNYDPKTGMWAKMFHYFQFRQEDFLRHYHARSNAESTFSMLKRKHGDFLRSKTDAALVNELLCKVLCHNICCVIQSMYEMKVEPIFWADEGCPKITTPA
jgi:transposase